MVIAVGKHRDSYAQVPSAEIDHVQRLTRQAAKCEYLYLFLRSPGSSVFCYSHDLDTSEGHRTATFLMSLNLGLPGAWLCVSGGVSVSWGWPRASKALVIS